MEKSRALAVHGGVCFDGKVRRGLPGHLVGETEYRLIRAVAGQDRIANLELIHARRTLPQNMDGAATRKAFWRWRRGWTGSGCGGGHLSRTPNHRPGRRRTDSDSCGHNNAQLPGCHTAGQEASVVIDQDRCRARTLAQSPFACDCQHTGTSRGLVRQVGGTVQCDAEDFFLSACSF